MRLFPENTSAMRRLFILVIVTIASYAIILSVSLYSMRKIAKDSSYLYRFQVMSIMDIASVYPDASALKTALLQNDQVSEWRAREFREWDEALRHLRRFQKRYTEQWETANGTNPDAARFRQDLIDNGQIYLLEDESAALREFSRAMSVLSESAPNNANYHVISSNVIALQKSLVALMSVNSKFASADFLILSERARQFRMFAITVSLLAMLVAILLCISVQRAIVPRVNRLVEKVRRFQETGVNEKFVDPGDDEIAVLANAIDAGFCAIENREKDRERFLAIAAHELKTPITSIYGFSSYLSKHSDDVEQRERAIEVINRQSWRLSRLVEDLFLAVKARSGQLRFRPESVELSSLVKKAAQEVEPFVLKQLIQVNAPHKVFVLGDETLLSHALWAFLSQASTLSGGTEPLLVTVERRGTFAFIVVTLPETNLTTESLQVLFSPFHSVEFEGQTSPRASMGLYLCKEIVKLHNGHLNAFVDGGEAFLQMELPA